MSNPDHPEWGPQPQAFYRRIDESTFESTLHAQGVWREYEQHMGPASGLLAHALQTVHPRTDLQLCRISYEILGVIAAGETEVRVEVVKPGRTVEMLQALLNVNGRTAIRATGWRLATFDTSSVAGGGPEPMAGPDDWPDWQDAERWPGGYIQSLDVRMNPDSTEGHGQAWLRTGKSLIEDEPVSDLVAFTALVDTANGIAGRLDPRKWMFPNTDLTIHYFRSPQFLDPGSGWVGLDATAAVGAEGVGLTSTTLHDGYGSVGRAEQILTVRQHG